tara:strand:+ start:518 stop:1444 length:927 start_codon:yes stop_codon:yes gene_type:complete
MKLLLFLLLVTLHSSIAYKSEYKEFIKRNVTVNILTNTNYPQTWNWRNINGQNYLTKNLNQHIPQYCGSCWAHGALSSLSDRIKIQRKSPDIDINLSIQYILNCGSNIAGSCYGGDHLAAYKFIYENGFVPYDTCLQYQACSSDSQEGLCQYGNYKCTPINTCRTCSTFTDSGGHCSPIQFFPNASISHYGSVSGTENIKKELFKNGPIACGVNAEPLLTYTGGIVNNTHQSQEINHIVSIVGWEYDPKTRLQSWIVRNSWGEYWGEMGFFRILIGYNILGIESNCAWAIPLKWTEINIPCFENGSNC